MVALLSNVAGWASPKIRLFVNGRRGQLQRLEAERLARPGTLVWFHCASLGEFEQARPLIEKIKSEFPDHRILLTFFSPSGYEVRRNYEYADIVAYLPWDTPSNAHRFVQIAQPSLAVFIKYEFWLNYSLELRQASVPLVSVSSIFRSQQIFFRWYGGFFRKTLQNFSYFFVQDDSSVALLKSIHINTVQQCGDTRFDRVFAIHKTSRVVPVAESFKAAEKLMVVGSCWPDDLHVLVPFIQAHQNQLKFIIAPHEISEPSLNSVQKEIGSSVFRFSSPPEHPEDFQVLLIDNVGMLANLYRYGEYAFIGGAYGKGLHNILEAACQGIPVFFGDRNYSKFREAVDLINRGGAYVIKDTDDLEEKYRMISTPEFYLPACDATRGYVEENLGATAMIMTHLRKLLQ